MKRTQHIRGTFAGLLALAVTSTVVLAVASATGADAAAMPRWTVAADSGATPPPPPPASTPAPAPAPVDTVPMTPAPAPAPADTAAVPASPAAADTTHVTPAVVAPAVLAAPAAVPPPAPLTKKQQRQQEKAAKNAGKKVDVDLLAPWNKGQTWLMVRAGYAKASESGSAPGGGGGALGVQRFLSARWAFGVIAQGDLLGKFGAAAEIEYPITVELTRHFRWKTPVRPYFGAGGGAYRHEYFRTGNDSSRWTSGWYMVGGANVPIGTRSILGCDGRMAFVSGDTSINNPVFGPEAAQMTHYSLKFGWSLTF